MCADVKTSGTELERLVSRLAEAEAELETVTSGAFDAVVDSSGHAHLLRQAQQALIESESQARQQAALLDAILRSAPDLITYVGSDGTVRWTNGGGEQRAMVVGEHWLAASPPGVETEELRRLFEVVVSTGCTMTHEGPERGPAGDERWIARRFGGVVENGKLVGVVIVSRDRTHERNAERQLMVSDRMASVGTLAAGVAHEINNPLASVLMNVEMALQEIRALPELGSVRDTLVEGLGDARVAAERVR